MNATPTRISSVFWGVALDWRCLPCYPVDIGRAGHLAERFHIAEWYGRPFLNLTDAERLRFAEHKVGGSAMTKAEISRLLFLENKKTATGLTEHQAKRLDTLREKLKKQQANELPCPFRTDTSYPTCNKAGGVCSLQLVTDDGGKIGPVKGEKSMVRATCPSRFQQNDTVFRHIGEDLLDDPAPAQLGEVGFLESSGTLDSEPGADVGNIDMILMGARTSPDIAPKWAAVEIQAVYFSGREMPIEFRQIKKDGGSISMPIENRRPDYRSCGPKRLMPQLQIKVPTLRRWGKKMAVVVDLAFFKSMGRMREVDHVSNADIVWYLVDFPIRKDGSLRELEVVKTVLTTLESAIEGLTGGKPVSMDEFENRIEGKLA